MLFIFLYPPAENLATRLSRHKATIAMLFPELLRTNVESQKSTLEPWARSVVEHWLSMCAAKRGSALLKGGCNLPML